MTATAGVLLALLAGILNGSFAAPTKYTGRWKWENIWALWAFSAFFLVPWIIALATVPGLLSVYAAAGSRALWLLIVFGIGYGITVPCFGLGVDALGIALNFAIAIGLSTALGSLVPLLTNHREQVHTAKGLTILAGIAITLLGIVVCAAAGKAKEKQLRPISRTAAAAPSRSFGTGLTFAIIAGLGSPLVNFGLAYGGPVLKAAAAQGASSSAQSNAVWPPLLTATVIPYLIYCAYLWRRNGSFRLFFAAGTASYWLLGLLMGLLWMGSIALYGTASATMAGMGPVLGWPLFMSAIIITSNVWGFATGEWSGVRRNTVLVMSAGMLLLIAAFCTLAWASALA